MTQADGPYTVWNVIDGKMLAAGERREDYATAAEVEAYYRARCREVIEDAIAARLEVLRQRRERAI